MIDVVLLCAYFIYLYMYLFSIFRAVSVEPIYSKYSPILIFDSGKVTWSIMNIFVTSCEIDSTYYPMDTQTCTITVTTWGATYKDVLLLDTKGLFSSVNTETFQQNGIWELVSSDHRIYEEPREQSSYSTIEYSFSFKRRARYYVMIIMLPVCLLSLLCCAVFILPPDSGEKIGFSLTVLLSYAVYLSLIADSIPETSLTLSLLSKYNT